MPKSMDMNLSILWIADIYMRRLGSHDLYCNLEENNTLLAGGISLTGTGLIGLPLSFMSNSYIDKMLVIKQ